jgi:hypothetical protein
MSRAMAIGSQLHKELFCRAFMETHESYDPQALDWPDLDAATLERLRALPFWKEAVETEGNTAAKVHALAGVETDPLVREAIALQGYEEARHSALLRVMTARYGIEVDTPPPDPLPANLEWGFIRTEYGECFDSFFAFGLFRLARESGFFPSALVGMFEPIVQEEARHILFFANWVAWARRQRPVIARPWHLLRCGTALCLQAWKRVETARGIQTGDFAMRGHESFETSISPGRFVDVCLEENERRLGGFDPRLLRPAVVPALARLARRFLS